MEKAQKTSFKQTPETSSTLTLQEPKSAADLLSSLNNEEVEGFLNSLSHNALLSLPWLFEHWAHAHQKAPDGDWKTWVILGGRGAGKTRAGAEWIRSQVEGALPEDVGIARRVALVAETLDQARDVMIFGDSGLIACAPNDRKPEWQASKRQLVWPNGAIAQIFSASDPESLRGPQFDCAWADELAKWKKGQETWDMLQFALRLGEDPRQVVTTTPRDNVLLRALLDHERTATTSAPTTANSAYLADSFLDHVEERYAGSRLGRQELEGELLSDTEGALWSRDAIDAGRLAESPELDRVVVAVDPPVTSNTYSDDCGIMVVGVTMEGPPQDWRSYVLEDGTMSAASPTAWAERAVNLYHKYGADRLVAEVNQGGDLVETLVRQIDPLASYKGVRATRGKVARAEPVSALYEQGRVFHIGGFGDLEDQMCQITRGGYTGLGSPDRVDALVWALTDLMVAPAQSYRAPHIRSL